MKKILAAVLCLSAVSAFPVSAAPAPPSSYSAVMTGRSTDGEYRAKMHVSGKRQRIEMQETTMIVRLDLNVTYMLMPQEKMYMEQAIDPRLAVQTGADMSSEIERKSLGREAVNGVGAEKFLVRYALPEAGEQAVVQWIGDDGMPIKTAAPDGSWTVEFTDVKVGAQPDALFEPPSDYQRMVMPDMSELMGAAQGR